MTAKSLKAIWSVDANDDMKRLFKQMDAEEKYIAWCKEHPIRAKIKDIKNCLKGYEFFAACVVVILLPIILIFMFFECAKNLVLHRKWKVDVKNEST